MTKQAKSVYLFGIYLILEGMFLMVAPSSILEAIGLPDPESVWRLILGFVVAILGYYYIRNARENLVPFFVFTTQVRTAQFLFFVGLYFFGEGTIALVGFSAIELFAGLWTLRLLKQEDE